MMLQSNELQHSWPVGAENLRRIDRYDASCEDRYLCRGPSNGANTDQGRPGRAALSFRTSSRVSARMKLSKYIVSTEGRWGLR